MPDDLHNDDYWRTSRRGKEHLESVEGVQRECSTQGRKQQPEGDHVQGVLQGDGAAGKKGDSQDWQEV